MTKIPDPVFYPFSYPDQQILTHRDFVLSYPPSLPKDAKKLKNFLLERASFEDDKTLMQRWEHIQRTSRFWLDERNGFLTNASEHISYWTGYSSRAVSELLAHFFTSIAKRRKPPITQIPPYWKQQKHFVIHICSGNIPTASFPGILMAHLLGAVQLIKVAENDPFSPYFLVESLRKTGTYRDYRSAPICVTYWKGGTKEWEQALAQQADIVAVYGGNEPMILWERLLLKTKPRLLFGPKISIQILKKPGGNSAKKVALDVALFDQEGCMSPHWCFLIGWSKEEVRQFAFEVEKNLCRIAEVYPPIQRTIAQKIHLRSFIDSYQFRPAEIYASDLTKGAVIIDYSRQPLLACGGRVLFIKPVKDFSRMMFYLKPFRKHLHTCAIGGISEGEKRRWIARLRALPFRRICSVGKMQKPCSFASFFTLPWLHLPSSYRD